MKVPSVKGAMLLSVVVLIRRARDQGKLAESDLASLSPETQELLDQRIQLAQWYPMEQFGELLDLDWRVHGGGDPEYMRQSGERNSSAMARSERYQQIGYVQRADRPRSTSQLLTQLRMTSTVTLSYFDFMEVDVRIDPERPNVVQITYSNTDALPEALRYSIEGFMNGLNKMRGSQRRWTSERVGHTIVFSLEMKQRSADDGE